MAQPADDDSNINFTITNYSGGNADIILFYSTGQEAGEQPIQQFLWSLGDGETSVNTESVVESAWDEHEFWGLSLFVKDGPNAGYYGVDGQWLDAGLDSGTYAFKVDTTSFKLCPGSAATMTQAGTRVAGMPAISHVFVVMLENRSFDHMLAFSGIEGITAATKADSNSYMFAIPTGPGHPLPTTINVRTGNPTTMPTDPGHEFPDVVTQLGGQFAEFDAKQGYPAVDNSGFLASYATSTSEVPYQPPMQDDWRKIMTCFDTPTNLPILHALASSYAVCDHWFSSLPGPTWPNRFFLHAASACAFDHSPDTADMRNWETITTLTFPNGTLFDRLDKAGVLYQLYQDYTWDGASAYASSGYQADSDLCYSSGAIPQAGAILPFTDGIRFHELSGLAQDLQAPYPYPYTFIEPHYGDIAAGTYVGGSSQHPMDEVYGGEALLQGVYDAISASPYWQSSLLIVCYDEHGGFYDSVPPPACVNPGDLAPGDPQWDQDNQYGFDFTQLGVRVPAVLVSPLIAPGSVSTQTYDHSSVSQMLSQLWGTETMTARDAAALSPFDDAALWQTTPSAPITLPPLADAGTANPPPCMLDRDALLDQDLPTSGNEIGLLFVLRKMDMEMSVGSERTREDVLARARSVKTRRDLHDYAVYVQGQRRLLLERDKTAARQEETLEPV